VSRIRVLQVIWRLSRAGGAQTVARGFLRHFDRSAFDVHVCTIRPLFEEDHVGELGLGITYHPLDLVGTPTVSLRAHAVRGVAKVARHVRPAVLHAHGGTAWYSIPGVVASRRSGRLLEVHDAPQSGRMSRGNQTVEQYLARRFGFRVLVHSTAVRDGVASAWSLDPEAVTLVPLGIEVDAFGRDHDGRTAVRAALGVGSDTPLVTYVARLVPEKRPELFLEVARRVLAANPEVVFALVGEGSSYEGAVTEAQRLGIDDRVRLPGFVDDLPGLYHASDIFLSTSRYEGFGLAIAEAMAAGVPVVATRVGGVEDVVGDTGILEPSDRADRLADHVLALLQDPSRREQLGRAAARRARERLDVRVTMRGFERCYRELASSSS
jgi:glycosyltransferase involved in cell wall biosynthesis